MDKDLVCDGVPQCQDRSDELHCMTETEGCVHHCDNKSRCLPANFLCDGERDCLDGTDELNCEDQEENKKEEGTSATSKPPVPTPIKCPLGSKPCKDEAECVLYNHVCDGEADCRDGSDEDECLSACETDQFQCAHGKRCIEQSQVCDGVPQCQDRSDELGCAKHTEGCAHQCDESRCIPNSFICDGERDCLDGSDEANCGVLYLYKKMEIMLPRFIFCLGDTCDCTVPTFFVAAEACSASEFKCTSGQCVSATVRCDGHPDCWDRSDEQSCTKAPVCTTKHRCPQSKECLVQEWICDGDQDCKDGTDEKDCPVTPLNCGKFQWSCKSKTKCIPTAWRCDGMKDCEDGSDETECGVVTCLPHQFQCGSQECLDPVLLCNGITNCADGSDEGGSCQINCAETDNKRCSQSCYSTPQGTRCHCAAGFRLMEDGLTCSDIDECEGQSSSVCSQLCINTPGSYQCDCHPGYIKEAGGRRCKITGEPFLLSSVQTDLFLFGLRSGSLDVLSSSAKKAVLSLDYDWREQRVFWVSLDTESIRWSSLDQKTTGIMISGVRADSVAVDWLGRNLYWIDGVNSQIVAIRLATATVKSLDHSVILDEDLDQPRSLALLPQKGLMFWTEIGNVVKIERAGMDGSERRAVVNSSLGWPGGVAVDTISDRIYWTDERLRSIGSATLDGDDIQAKHFRIGTSIYCLLALKGHVPSFIAYCVSKFKCYNTHLFRKFSVFMEAPTPNGCSIIYLQSRHTTAELKGWPEHLALQVPSVNEAAIMDYSLRDHTLFLTDDGTTSLRSFKLKDSDLVSQGQLLKLQGNTITAMALDWVTLNIYWSSNKQPRLQVTSITGAHTAVLLKEGIGSVESIALCPPSGKVCFTNLGLQDTGTVATVECANMDGAERHVVWKDAVQPTSLVFSSNGATIYWADNSLGVIGSVQLDGSGYKELKAGNGLAALALSDDMLLWMTVSDKTRLWYRDEQQQNRLWFEVGTEVVSLKAFSKSSQTGSNQCAENNGNCQHLCLAIPAGRTCKCAHDNILMNGTHCAPEQHCPAGSKPCLDDLSCQPVEKFCNGHVDCSDHSDENCVKLWSGVKVRAPTQSHGSSSPPSPTPLSEGTGFNISLNTSNQLLHLDAQKCSQRHCSGSGRCVEINGDTACVCSLGYSGDSCQDHLLKTMQGPIVYSAAGLCAGIVVIAVMAAVVCLTVGDESSESSEFNSSEETATHAEPSQEPLQAAVKDSLEETDVTDTAALLPSADSEPTPATLDTSALPDVKDPQTSTDTVQLMPDDPSNTALGVDIAQDMPDSDPGINADTPHVVETEVLLHTGLTETDTVIDIGSINQPQVNSTSYQGFPEGATPPFPSHIKPTPPLFSTSQVLTGAPVCFQGAMPEQHQLRGDSI
ncbi:hypothetical protein PAMP_022171 [Pampus punctatissimus]